MWAVGLVVSFVSAFLVIRWLIRYVATHDFRWFAWYRIAFGVLVLLTALLRLGELAPSLKSGSEPYFQGRVACGNRALTPNFSALNPG